MAFYYETHVERLNTPCGQNVDFVVLNLMGHTLTSSFKRVKRDKFVTVTRWYCSNTIMYLNQLLCCVLWAFASLKICLVMR
jgi:hypothetical protein